MISLAAAQLMRQAVAPWLLFSGGHTAGTGHPSESAAMRDYLYAHSPRRESELLSVLLEEKSIDTADNARRVREVCQDHGFRTIALLTTAHHLAAARGLFRTFGLNVCAVYAAEDVLHVRSRHHERFVRRYRGSCRYKREWVREQVRRPLLLADPRGRALRHVTNRLRK
jgi:uncharacterized SAM-binding protein YcdF (DUF218 family)